MINWIINYKINKIKEDKSNFEKNDLLNIKSVLFSLFTRYGDTIIDLCVIKEFIALYPNKKYTILCPKQMMPYVSEILPTVNTIGFNKRNIFSFFKIVLFLKKEKFDIGFNPWSNGNDSCYWISFAKKFICYKGFKRPEIINHYEVVRSYLQLKNLSWEINKFVPKKIYKKIIICPESTDPERSISYKETKKLIHVLQKKYDSSEIIICAMDNNYFLESCTSFRFSKKQQSSLDFLSLLKTDSLNICVDSGPLHIMTALNLDTIGIFNTTKPEFVINTNSKINIISKEELYDI